MRVQIMKPYMEQLVTMGRNYGICQTSVWKSSSKESGENELERH